ncbi:DUF6035 family protein [Hydrogenophaga sp.]|uniref:DUF6035 family protein n=1 Tax=Hydrogenophaga sp. TaxID=1904254 RepID=UPI0025BD85F1|nr:DUF6035 family protein [Hydrogenophaga sp.]
MDTDSGDHLRTEVVLGNDFASLVQLRMDVQTAMNEERPLYRCAICMVPVYICRNMTQTRFFFRHRGEDGNCPAITRGELPQDEIDARRYNGAKESRQHLQMKAWVAECLAADSRFSDIQTEKRWNGAFTGEWRKPDVQATFNGIPVAFEIQLSTTFLNVIVGRRQFYLKEGGLLFWIFASFDNEHRRMTDEDVYYNNNQNAFIVNANTVKTSLEQERFFLDCAWSVPTVDGSNSALHRKVVAFDELTLDPATQRAFYFDYDGHRDGLRSAKVSEAEVLRDEVEAWWDVRYETDSPHSAWLSFAARLRKLGLEVPYGYNEIDAFGISALYSAKHNRPYGQGKKRLVEVAHSVATGSKGHLIWFMHAVRYYDREASMAAEGTPGAWVKKYEQCKREYRNDMEPFTPIRKSQALIEYLFPELMPLP